MIWEDMPDGSARVRPVPDIMSFLGSAHTDQPRDPSEKAKGRSGWGQAKGSISSRAAHVNWKKVEEILDRVPDHPPISGDEL